MDAAVTWEVLLVDDLGPVDDDNPDIRIVEVFGISTCANGHLHPHLIRRPLRSAAAAALRERLTP